MSIISNFIFHKGDDGIWSAVTRDNYFDLFNDSSKVLYRSRSIIGLESLILRSKGNPTKIEEILEEDKRTLRIDDRPDKAGCTVPDYNRSEEDPYY